MTTTKEVSIGFYVIFSISQRISSFEGRSAVSPSGDSDYAGLRITDQDAPLLKDYIKEACSVVAADLGYFIYEIKFEEDKDNKHALLPSTFVVSFMYDSARTSLNNLENMLAETVASRTVMRWIDERKPARREFFISLYNEMLRSIKVNLGRKKKPSLSDYDS